MKKLVILIGLLIVVLGGTLFKLVPLQGYQRRINQGLANNLHGGWVSAAQWCETAQQRLAAGESPLGALQEARDGLLQTQVIIGYYAVALEETSGNAPRFAQLQHHPQRSISELNDLIRTLEREPSLTPAQHASLAMLGNDFRLLATHFSESVLDTFDPAQLEAIVRDTIQPQLQHPIATSIFRQ